VGTLKIRELGVTERERFVTEWHTVQSRFVDHPKTAVTEADDLINALLEARGYPQAGFEQRAADVSVNYPRVMENYRVAHSIAVRLGQVEATTEELRTAMIQYRNIFDDLLQAPKTARNKNRCLASGAARMGMARAVQTRGPWCGSPEDRKMGPLTGRNRCARQSVSAILMMAGIFTLATHAGVRRHPG
jgi:hypothetical protein